MTAEEARAKATELTATAREGQRFVADYFTSGAWYVRGYNRDPLPGEYKTWIAAK